jgi:ribonuclease-3
VKPDQFHRLTDYLFRDPQLLEQALTHRSYARSRNNERLEFLGDSVLSLVISRHIFQQFPDAKEGELSRLRATLVKQATLARVARDLGLGEHLHLGSGELKSGGYRRDSILADALEAVIGAVYLDSDFVRAESMVLGIFRTRLQNLDIGRELKDPKTRLQEYLQARQSELPIYAVEQTRGKSHNQIFTVSCSVPELKLQAQGSGASRKKAEQLAAQSILDQLEI